MPDLRKFPGAVALLLLISVLSWHCNGKKDTLAIIHTDMGDIKVHLFESTPRHRANFIRLAETGFYDSLLFHRVVRDFIIQGGDPGSRNAPAGAHLGDTDVGYTVPAEIGAPHLRGALAAARLTGPQNPAMASDGAQFFIVQGRPQTDASLDALEKSAKRKIPAALRAQYKLRGGAPQLDGQYTVFGEVVSGMEVVDRIGGVPRDGADRPLQDIRMRIQILE